VGFILYQRARKRQGNFPGAVKSISGKFIGGVAYRQVYQHRKMRLKTLQTMQLFSPRSFDSSCLDRTNPID
jgi:hypothetical protein